MRRWRRRALACGLITVAGCTPTSVEPAPDPPVRFLVGIQPPDSGGYFLHALTEAGRVVEAFPDSGRYLLSDLTSKPGCPTLASGSMFTGGFSNDTTSAIVSGSLVPLLPEVSAWAPIYGVPGCSASFLHVGEGSTAVRWRARVIEDTRRASGVDEDFIDTSAIERIRQAIGPDARRLTNGPPLSSNEMLVALGTRGYRGHWFARVDRAGRVAWKRWLPVDNFGIDVAGDRAILGHRVVVDLRSGQRLGRTPWPLTDVRQDGSQALAVDGQRLLVLEGTWFDRVAEEVVVDPGLRTAAWATEADVAAEFLRDHPTPGPVGSGAVPSP